MKRFSAIFIFGLLGSVQAALGQQSAAVSSMTVSPSCLASLPPDFLLESTAPWARDLIPSAAGHIAVPYQDFRECLGLAGADLGKFPVPESIKSWIHPEDDGVPRLLRFYRSCGAGNPRSSLSQCKSMVKEFLGGFLDPGADWDALCADWCADFKSPRGNACEQAAAKYLAPVWKTPGPMIAACRELAGFQASDCNGLDRKAACVKRAAGVEAVRSGAAPSCGDPSDWRCRAAASGDPHACVTQFSAQVANQVCSQDNNASPEPNAQFKGIQSSTLPVLARGSVVDADGVPLPGISVEVRLSSAPESAPCASVDSDAAGFYSVPAGAAGACGRQALIYPQTLFLTLRGPSYLDLGTSSSEAVLKAAGDSAEISWAPGSVHGTPKLVTTSGVLCADVQVEGRPLTEGLASLLSDSRPSQGGDEFAGGKARPGLTERSLVRFNGSSFCMKNLSPGNYRIAVFPMGFPGPLPLRLAGSPYPLSQYRISVGEDGSDRVYDAAGQAVDMPASGPIKLEYAAPAPDGLLQLSVTLSFPAGSSNDFSGEPLLFLAGTSTQTLAAWVPQASLTAQKPFAAQAPAVKELRFSLGSSWAISSWQSDTSDSAGPIGGSRQAVSLRVVPGAVLTGSVLLPDAKPFRPRLGSAADASNWIGMSMTKSDGTRPPPVAVDWDGRYKIAAAPGAYMIKPSGHGSGFTWGQEPNNGVWVSSASANTMDFSVEPGAGITVTTFLDGNASEGSQQRLKGAQGRFLYGLRQGTSLADVSWMFLFPSSMKECPIFLARSADGGWVTDDGTPVEGNRFPVGTYDFYLIEKGESGGSSVAKILGSVKGVRLVEGAKTPVQILTPYASAGTAAVHGDLRVSKKPSPGVLLGSDSWFSLLAGKLPRVELFNGENQLVAAAFAFKDSDLQGLGDALNREDAAALDAVFAHLAYAYQVEGLAAGRYHVRVDVAGYPSRSSDVDVSEGKSALLDVDLDAP